MIPQQDGGMKRSFKPFLYMVLGGAIGFIFGAILRMAILSAVGGIFAQFDNSIQTMGDIPIWVNGPVTLLAWGITIIGAIKGYRIGLRQALNAD
jgi:hypothetical protein